MSHQELFAEARKLPVSERQQLMEELWESLSETTEMQDWQKSELDRRLNDAEKTPVKWISLDEVNKSIQARLSK